MKSFIIDRSGLNPVLKPTNDRKVPVYDTLQDAEADLANLEENQIGFTNEMVVSDSVKAYIRNQNLLSDWESITIPIGAENAITMDYDGFIMAIYSATGGSATVIYYVIDQDGNIARDTGHATYNTFSNGATLVFKKGDKIYKTASQASVQYAEEARYYKQRDYTGR